MSLDLRARALLDNRPYLASLKEMSAATAAHGKSVSSHATKEVADQQKVGHARRIAGRAYVAETAAANREIERIQRASMAQQHQGLNAQRYLYADMSRMAAGAALGLAAIPAAAIAAGVAWERSFSDVVRTADPVFSDSQASVDNLRRSLVDMVQTMPANWGDVTGIATLANQMGIASSETASFTRAVAMFSSTSGVSVDIAATAFGRLRSIVPDIGSDFMGLADAILKVGVNSVATEGEIINIVTQISSIAGAAGMGSRDMIGLAGAMASVKVPPELSRGVITRVFGQISRATATGGAALDGFAKVAGMSAEDFKRAWGKDGDTGEAFKSFVSGLQELGPRAEAELRGLGITSVRDVPVMLRLASAADSEGNIGGLLTQTMEDAENAAGETQRQYGIMADTVGAKLQIVGNNVVAFFDAISGSSMGLFGDILDNVAEGIADFTNSLDDAVKLFGLFELPMTNGELLGFGAAAALAASGVLLLGSGLAKAAQAAVTMKTFRGMMAPGGGGRAGGDPTGISQVANRWTAFPGQVQRGMDRAVSAASRGYGQMYATARRYTQSLEPLNRNQLVYASGRGAERYYLDTAKVAEGASNRMAASAERATSRVTSSFSRMGAGVASAGRGIGAAASFAFGPWGLLLGVATAGFAALVESTRAASTNVSHLAEDIAKFGDSAKGLEALENITLGGLFGNETRPFEDGYKSLEQMKKAAQDLREVERYDVNPGNARFTGAANTAKAMGENQKLTADYAKAVGILDDAFQEMVNGGNGARAAQALTTFAGSSKELMGILDSKSADNMRRFYQSAFDLNDINLNESNLEKLARGQLPEVQAALLGVANATSVTAAELDSLDGGAAAFSAMAKAAEEVALGFISYADAVAAAKGETDAFDMSKFSEELGKQIEAQNAWASNLQQAGQFGGSQFVEALLKMGTDAQLPLQAIIDDFNATGGDLNGNWKGWMDQLILSTDTAASEMGPAAGAVRDAMTQALGDANLTDILARKLTPDQFTTASRGMQQVGRDFATKIANGISDGSMSVEQAITELTFESARISMDFDMTPAQVSLATMVAIANGTVTTMQLDALPDLAQNAVWETVQMADGTTGFIQLDATSGEVMEEFAYVVDTATGTVAKIPLTADDTAAINSINSVKGTADGTVGTVIIRGDASAAEAVLASLSSRVTYSTHVIQVMQQRFSDDAIAYGAADGDRFMANGGVMTFYANGGMSQGGENHTAHIAPAGSWRTFGEAETEGEAYIPLARRKRTRSISILENVANRFGMSLSNASQYANGGQYHSQQYSRSTATVRSAPFGSSGLSASDRQFFADMLRTVVVTADRQAITTLANDTNVTNGRFNR